MTNETGLLPAHHEPNRYVLRVGRWGMYVHDLNIGKDIDMETVRDLLNQKRPPAPSPDKAAALNAFNSIIFSDGAGAVCRWANEYQKTICAALQEDNSDLVEALEKIKISCIESETHEIAAKALAKYKAKVQR